MLLQSCVVKRDLTNRPEAGPGDSRLRVTGPHSPASSLPTRRAGIARPAAGRRCRYWSRRFYRRRAGRRRNGRSTPRSRECPIVSTRPLVLAATQARPAVTRPARRRRGPRRRSWPRPGSPSSVSTRVQMSHTASASRRVTGAPPAAKDPMRIAQI